MPAKPHPLIFMVKPPSDVAQIIDDLRIQLGAPRRYSTDRLHMTLLRVGDTESRTVQDTSRMIAIASAMREAPFRVSFDLVGGTVLLGSDKMRGAINFQRNLARAMLAYCKPSPSRFSPHISLHYETKPLFDCSVDGISWLVEEFMLIESIQGEGRHEVLGRFPLIA